MPPSGFESWDTNLERILEASKTANEGRPRWIADLASRDIRKAANFSFIEPTFHHLEQDFMLIATGSPQRVSKQEVIDRLLFVLMQIALVLSDKYFGWEVSVAGPIGWCQVWSYTKAVAVVASSENGARSLG